MKNAKKDWDKVRWTAFQEAFLPEPADEMQAFRLGQMTKRGIKIFRNSIYQVEMEVIECPPPLGLGMYLSFKTLDKQARHDWREIQRIKNELVGEEVEAVELYPAESRVVDTSNQYHLYCFPNLGFEGKVFPFGFRERLISEGSEPGINETGKGSRQRDFRPEFRPIDTVRNEDLKKLRPNSGIAGMCPTDKSPLIYKGTVRANLGGKDVVFHRAECLKGIHTCFFANKDEVDDAEDSNGQVEVRGSGPTDGR